MIKISIDTKTKKQIVDITDRVSDLIKDKQEGIIHLFLTHTTAGLTTADLDPGTDKDILNALTAMIPKMEFNHPHDPAHAPDHILSAIVGCDLSIPFAESKLILGKWQRIVLIEFDGPRTREIVVNLI